MKKLSLILFIALMGTLVLTACSQIPAEMVPENVRREAIQGQEVAANRIRLYSDPQQRNLAFEIDNGRVYEGPRQRGQAVLFFDGRRIYRGANSTGEILFNVSGDRVFVGANTTGPVAYTVRNGRVYEGTDQGPIIYTISGDRMYHGPNTTGDIVFDANVPLTGDIQFLLPVLADRRGF